jgi:hypothetical protein
LNTRIFEEKIMFTTYHLTGSICMVTIVLILGTLSLASASPFTLALENVPPGDLPPGWRIAATNPQGRLAEWAVVPDAGSAKVFSLTKIHDGSRGGVNLCWNPAMAFCDGQLEVKVRANSGTIDQGGG